MTTDYLSRNTPPVCQQEPGSVYDHILTAIQRERKTNRYKVIEKIFVEAYDLYIEFRYPVHNCLFGDVVKNEILENPTYTPLHGMVMACLYAAFDRDDEVLEFLVANLKDQPGYVYFKPIISYYRSKRILDDYADKERIDYIRSLEKKEIELNNKLEEYERQIKLLQFKYDALKESIPSKQENTLTLEEILDYMRNNAMTMDTCERIVAMLNHFSSSFTEDGQKQVHKVSTELRNESLTKVVNNNHIESSNVIQGVMKDSKFSKVK